MMHLDLSGMHALWDRISNVFARKTEAVGSGSLSGTSVVLKAVSGGTLSTIDLDPKFATDDEAAHNLEMVSKKLVLTNVNGNRLAVVDLNDDYATDAQAGHKLTRDGAKITLYSVDNTELNSVDLTNYISTAASDAASDAASGKASETWVKNNFACHLRRNGRNIELVDYYGSTINTISLD